MNSPASAQNTPQRVLLVGAGGIGSHLTDLLCRGLHGHALDLTLMDGDVVEERNLAHQRFQPNDIGQAKADVLAETHAKTIKPKPDVMPRTKNTFVMNFNICSI